VRELHQMPLPEGLQLLLVSAASCCCCCGTASCGPTAAAAAVRMSASGRSSPDTAVVLQTVADQGHLSCWHQAAGQGVRAGGCEAHESPLLAPAAPASSSLLSWRLMNTGLSHKENPKGTATRPCGQSSCSSCKARIYRAGQRSTAVRCL